MDINILILLALIAASMVAIGVYAIYKKLLKFLEKIQKIIENPFETLLTDEKLEPFMQRIINNEKYQRFLFESGAIAANGAKGGLGLDKLMPKGGNGGGMLGKLLGLYNMFKQGGGGIAQAAIEGATQPTQPTSDEWGKPK